MQGLEFNHSSHLQCRLRMRGAITPFHTMPSWNSSQYLISYKKFSSVFFNLSLILLSSCCQVLCFICFKSLAMCIVSHWFMDIAPAKGISKLKVVILADRPNIPCRMPTQCSSLYHSRFVLYADQHMDLQSFRLCPVQITVGLNTSVECCFRMWL